MRALRCRRGTGAFAHHASAAPRPAGTRLAWLAQCSLGECGSKCSAATYLGAWFPTLALHCGVVNPGLCKGIIAVHGELTVTCVQSRTVFVVCTHTLSAVRSPRAISITALGGTIPQDGVWDPHTIRCGSICADHRTTGGNFV